MPIPESKANQSAIRGVLLAAAKRWWKRGAMLWLVFSIPSACGALGLRWMPYGVAAIAGGLAAGLLIAWLADALFPRTRTSGERRSLVSDRLNGPGHTKTEECLRSTICQRLDEGKARLEHLDTERTRRGDSGFGKTTEDRIVWGELLDLELQDIDEQIRRICHAAGAEPDYRPRP